MLVSFIIPSYNSAHTVKRCLDSIYALSLKQEEFEVIFVDDFSRDNTCEIVEAYSQPLPEGKGVNNLSLLKQPKNNRQGAARNRGVSVAKGEYICFVDSDDAVTEGVVDAIRLAKEKQADMVAFHFARTTEQEVTTSEAEKLTFAKQEIFTGVEMQNKHFYWCSAPWGYIYKTDFLRQVNYPFAEGVLYEDSDFVMVHLYYAKRMVYSQALGYLAYYREGSTTHSVSFKNQSDYLLLGTRMLAFYTIIQQDIDSGNRTDDGIQEFADGVLEGAIHNVTMSLKRLYKLNSPAEIVRFYRRIDSKVNRHVLYADPRMYKYTYGWNKIAHLSIRHKYLSIFVNSCLLIAYQLYLKLKK